MSWKVIAIFALLQVRENKGLDSGSDHDNVEEGRPSSVENFCSDVVFRM